MTTIRYRSSWVTPCMLLALLVFLPATASAHSESGSVGGFASGFAHPLSGLDHIVAMVAVGLWGAFLGGRAMWTLPVVFPVVMAFGGALGILGVPVPSVETGIALSGIILGLMVSFAAKPPLWVAAVIVGFFAIFHGHAHGTELPAAANAMTFAIGFVVCTGLLHLTRISHTALAKLQNGGFSSRKPVWFLGAPPGHGLVSALIGHVPAWEPMILHENRLFRRKIAAPIHCGISNCRFGLDSDAASRPTGA